MNHKVRDLDWLYPITQGFIGTLSFHLLILSSQCFQFELLCCVQDDHDPAINLVNKLREKYPKVDCSLFIGILLVFDLFFCIHCR